MAAVPYTFEQRVAAFWERVDRSAGAGACWTWTGAVTSKWGYGCFQVGSGRVLGAHKIAWLLTNGDPGSLCVLHRCDNRVCVNPAHLFLGTKKDNMQDAVAKGRNARGEMVKINKLTAALVREIRQEFRFYSPRRTNAGEIAARLGIDRDIVYMAGTGRTWKHIPMPERGPAQ